MKGVKVLLPFIMACCWMLSFPGYSRAHWIQTHQKIISLAKSALSNASPYDKIHTFLDSVDGPTGKTYLRLIMEGVRDADLRANGLYRVDCHSWNPCWDWDLTQNDSSCYPVTTLPDSVPGPCNDIGDWPVGDHGYDPVDGRGFFSLITDYSTYLEDKQAANPTGYSDLLSALSDLYPAADPESKLIEILQSSNAGFMAQAFYDRARRAWQERRWSDAMYNLGLALHAIQDTTVPYHTCLVQGDAHIAYETYTWEQTLESGARVLSAAGDYACLSPQRWVDRNAGQSRLFSLDPAVSSEACVLLGVNSTIGVMASFFRSVGYLPNPVSFLSVLLLDNSSGGGVLRVPQTYATIQEAIDAATTGGVVVVADGVYTGAGNKNLDFKGKAITVTSENGPAGCIIDCQQGGRGFYFHSGEGAGSVVSGFTIINGRVEGLWPDACGGGIYCNASSPTIENCVISHNTAMEPGGGIACISSSPTIRSCILTNNSSHAGGGASFFQSQPAVLINCIITRNLALNIGGGIDCGMSTLNLINSTVAYNSALSYPNDGGGGISVSAGSSASIVNSIFWENSGSQIVASFQTTQVAYSLVQGGFTGTGNLNGDPLFENAAADNFHLQAGSPCIDSGAAAAAADTDIDGIARPQGAGYDMGAYEFH